MRTALSGIALFASSLGWADGDGLSLTAAERAYLESFRGKVKIGMEIEVSDPSMQQMIRWFDFDQYQRNFPWVLKELSDAQVKAYLDDPANLDSLPEALRQQLTEGLGSFKVELHAPANTAGAGPERGVLVDAAGKSLTANATRIQPPAPLAVPHAQTRPEPGKLILPDSRLKVSPADRARVEWAEVQRRWRALSRVEALGGVRLRRLPPSVLAVLVASDRIKPLNLKIRDDLPPTVKQLMANFEWVRDGNGIVEFRHRVPLEDPIEYLKQVKAFGEYAGVRREMAQPWSARGRMGEMPYGYHFHLSLGNQDLAEPIATLNLLKAVRTVAKGGDPFVSFAQVSYRTLDQKGLVRQVEPNRVEVRDQHASPESELLESLSFMSDAPAARTALVRELTPAVLDRLSQRSEYLDPNFLMELGQFRKSCGSCDFSSDEVAKTLLRAMNGAETQHQFARVNAARLADALDIADPAVKARSRDILTAELTGLASPDPSYDLSIRALRGVRDPEIEAAIVRLLKHPNEWVRLRAIQALGRSLNPKALEQLVDILPETGERGSVYIGQGLGWAFSTGRFADVRKRMEVHLSSSNKDHLQATLFALRKVRDPELALRVVPLIFRDREFVGPFARSIIRNNLSPEVVRAVLAQAARVPDHRRGDIGPILLDARPHAPEEQRAIAALFKGAGQQNREMILDNLDPASIDPLVASHLLTEIESDLWSSTRERSFKAAVRAHQSAAAAAGSAPSNCLGGVLVQLRIRK